MIRNIIFDLGGVLLNLGMEKTSRAFRDLGMKDFDAHFTQAKQSGVFDAFDCGKISPAEFRSSLKKHLPETVTDGQIDFAWNAMLLDLPPERLELLQSLGKKYRLFLLSNTNEIHVAAFSAYLENTFGKSDFSDYFEKWYYSCRIGMRKPNAEIFDFVLRENKLEANETLFIDDSPQHLTGANLCGINSLLLNPGENIISLLEKEELI
ncbi:MAG TPA: HAD family phosphatase [Bacteroidia bacterium]|nr:HAD family phosphatase [Bacteroidia bacterium]